MKRFGKYFGLTTVVLAFAYVGTYYATYPKFTYTPETLKYSNFADFYKARLERSKAKNVREDNEERLVRRSKGKSEYAILYIHGFGASRKEGEEVVDAVSEKWNANTYYLLLPGHGVSIEDHRDTPYTEYIQEVEETFQAMSLLGDKIIVVGTSMGGLLSTYLASKYSDKIYALILASPYYDFDDPSGRLFFYPLGSSFVRTLLGEIRTSAKPKSKMEEESYKYWLKGQYYQSLENLGNLKKLLAKEEIYTTVTCPTLLLYYYKNETEKDKAASVPEMLKAFDTFGKATTPNPKNRKVAIERGNHILLSKYVETDREMAKQEILNFLDSLKK